MKTGSLLFTLALLCVFTSHAQKSEKEENPPKKTKCLFCKKGTDTLVVHYNARTGVVTKNFPYRLKDEGTVVFKVDEINLLRYNLTLTEMQNDIISSEHLAEGNSQVNIDPAIFNVTSSDLDIQITPVSMTPEAIKLKSKEEEQRFIEIRLGMKKEAIENNRREHTLLSDRINTRNYFVAEKRKQDSRRLRVKATAESEKRTKELALIDAAIDSLDNLLFSLNLQGSARQDSIDIKTTIENEKTLSKELNSLIQELQTVSIEIETAKSNVASYSLRFERFNNSLNVYKRSLANLNELTELYQRLLACAYSDQSQADIERDRDSIMLQLFGKANVRRDEILRLAHQRLQAIDTSFMFVSGNYSPVASILTMDKTEKTKTLIADAEKAKEVFDQIAAFHKQISRKPYQDFFLQIVRIYDAINESNFSFTHHTNIISDNADVITYSLIAKPHANLPASLETKPVKFNYNVWVKGGAKIDVSSGLFWNFEVFDSTYRFVSASDSTTRVVGERNDNLFIPSVGLLFELYRRTDRNVKIGWNVGFSTNAERLNYHTGVSVLIGKSERLNMNFGITGAQVKRAADQYRGNTLLSVPIGDLPDEVPLQQTSPFRIGYFVGVTYNLHGRRNTEALNQIVAP